MAVLPSVVFLALLTKLDVVTSPKSRLFGSVIVMSRLLLPVVLSVITR